MIKKSVKQWEVPLWQWCIYIDIAADTTLLYVQWHVNKMLTHAVFILFVISTWRTIYQKFLSIFFLFSKLFEILKKLLYIFRAEKTCACVCVCVCVHTMLFFSADDLELTRQIRTRLCSTLYLDFIWDFAPPESRECSSLAILVSTKSHFWNAFGNFAKE